MTALLRRHRRVSRRWGMAALVASILGALAWWAAMVPMMAAAICPLMLLVACTVDGGPAVATGLVLALGARVTWLGVGAYRGIGALEQIPVPPQLAAAAARMEQCLKSVDDRRGVVPSR